MKLPRGLVWTLLVVSLLGSVVLPGWWWTVWPGRTVSAFAAAIRHGDFERANQFLETGRQLEVLGPDDPTYMILKNVHPSYGFGCSAELWQEFSQAKNVVLHTRTWRELARGQQRFD